MSKKLSKQERRRRRQKRARDRARAAARRREIAERDADTLLKKFFSTEPITPGAIVAGWGSFGPDGEEEFWLDEETVEELMRKHSE